MIESSKQIGQKQDPKWRFHLNSEIIKNKEELDKLNIFNASQTNDIFKYEHDIKDYKKYINDKNNEF